MQQPIQNVKPAIRNKVPTPLEQLLAEKSLIEERCRLQKKKLNEDFVYIQDNAYALLVSGLFALFFPVKNANGKVKKQVLPGSGDGHRKTAENVSLSVSDYLNIAKGFLPVVWEIVQPLVLTWCISKAKSLLSGLFSGKKRRIS
ncbi:MAG: hypothetical protein LBH77_08215 [Tannerella sp.]|jgi:hypothetical protein|nr:hypothetical protein [Tannerella sp.]